MRGGSENRNLEYELKVKKTRKRTIAGKRVGILDSRKALFEGFRVNTSMSGEVATGKSGRDF